MGNPQKKNKKIRTAVLKKKKKNTHIRTHIANFETPTFHGREKLHCGIWPPTTESEEKFQSSEVFEKDFSKF